MSGEGEGGEGNGESESDSKRTIAIQLLSFGYRFGQPKDTVFNFNARKLKNPGK